MRLSLVLAGLLVVTNGLALGDHRSPSAQADVTRTHIRILYVEFQKKQQNGQKRADQRFPKTGFRMNVVWWSKLAQLDWSDYDVILLPTGWAYDADRYKKMEALAGRFHAYVRRGGGLLVCQPNPSDKCTPTLLPYSITFRNGYDDKQPGRVHLAKHHFITSGLPQADLPFPYDPMTNIDRRYTLLAKQKSTGSPSLAVTEFGRGRVVVQTANENSGANIPLGDKILHRMAVWVARRGW